MRHQPLKRRRRIVMKAKVREARTEQLGFLQAVDGQYEAIGDDEWTPPKSAVVVPAAMLRSIATAAACTSPAHDNGVDGK
jgi:hypothetical protein